MFFGLEALFVSNIVLPLLAAGTIAVVDRKPQDKQPTRRVIRRN